MRTLLLAFALLAAYLGWNVYVVERRSRLLQHRADYGAHIDMYREGAAAAPPNVIVRIAPAATFFESRSDSFRDRKIKVVGPKTSADLPFLRRCMGDQAVAWIILTDAAVIDVFREAFPEASIVVDPAAQPSIVYAWRKFATAKPRPAGVSPPSGN